MMTTIQLFEWEEKFFFFSLIPHAKRLVTITITMLRFTKLIYKWPSSLPGFFYFILFIFFFCPYYHSSSSSPQSDTCQPFVR
jgi:hypothetical protein